MPGKISAKAAVVVVQIRFQRLKPILTSIICSYERLDAERINVAYLIVVYGTVYPPAHILVGNDDIGYLQTGYVERLARRHAGDGVCKKRSGVYAEIGCKRSKRDVTMGREYELAVNLVGHHAHTITQTYLTDSYQFVACPHPSGNSISFTFGIDALRSKSSKSIR